jgi:hypothetical protein
LVVGKKDISDQEAEESDQRPVASDREATASGQLPRIGDD